MEVSNIVRTKICVECGKEFTVVGKAGNTKILCSPECAKQRKNKQMYSYQKKNNDVSKQKAKPRKKRADKGVSLTQMAMEARKMGMSYGKYSIYLQNGGSRYSEADVSKKVRRV